jgi:tetratricopeptide (TPR) repeat protein
LYNLAIEYFEKGIRNYMLIRNPDYNTRRNISAAYLDLGIVYFEIGEFNTALKYFEKSREIKSRYKLPEKAFVDLNIAKTFVKLSRSDEAEKFFKESRDLLISEFGPFYYRLPEVYFEYGQFLYASGRQNESLEILNKALSICIKNYGQKHTLTSFAYKLIGDYYIKQADYPAALRYYQESLISIVSEFNDHDVLANPGVDSSLFDIRLLDNLKVLKQLSLH